MAKALDEVVDKSDYLLVLALQIHQTWLDLALHATAHTHGVWLEAKRHPDGLGLCHRRRQGNFLQVVPAASSQPLHQVCQMAATIAREELVHLIDNQHTGPLE